MVIEIYPTEAVDPLLVHEQHRHRELGVAHFRYILTPSVCFCVKSLAVPKDIAVLGEACAAIHIIVDKNHPVGLPWLFHRSHFFDDRCLDVYRKCSATVLDSLIIDRRVFVFT